MLQNILLSTGGIQRNGHTSKQNIKVQKTRAEPFLLRCRQIKHINYYSIYHCRKFGLTFVYAVALFSEKNKKTSHQWSFQATTSADTRGLTVPTALWGTSISATTLRNKEPLEKPLFPRSTAWSSLSYILSMPGCRGLTKGPMSNFAGSTHKLHTAH